MIKRTFFLISFLATSAVLFSQYKLSEGIAYSTLTQMDSSNYYLMGSLITKADRSKYLTTDNSFRSGEMWMNVIIYNSATDQFKKLFSTSLNLVYPVNGNAWRGGGTSGVFGKMITYMVKTDGYNNDGVIDEDDPTYLYVSEKSGDNLKQLTPDDFTVSWWAFSYDKKTMIIKGQRDTNKDKKFKPEDDLFYKVILDENIANIKVMPLIVKP
jgi:hypothetical protein